MKKFKVGIYEGLSYEEYAEIPAWRSHDLTTLIKCPYTWRHKGDISESPALLEGRVQHTVFGELHKFDDEFAIEPIVDRRTKAGKAEYAEWLEGVGDRTPIKKDLYDVCLERREVLKEFIPKPMDKVELTVCFEWHGEPCKGRMDWYDGKDIWDLKTCRDASPRGFRSAINNFRYYQQAAYYLAGARLSGLPAEKFYFLAVEKQSPYPYGVYTLSDEAIAFGDARNEQAIAIAQQCFDSGEWMPFNNAGVTEFDVDELW
tara:strand:- start:618 stop:1394 length:777 start_codon:yes stop_codon:yes gene_type:complete